MPASLQAAILGIVQGVTEFLPVSSTAHLLIAERLLGFQDRGGVFTVMIQLGSIVALLWLFREKVLATITGLPSDPKARRFALMLIVAVVPALVAGALLSGFVTRVLYNALAVNGVTFIVGGIIILLVERYQPRATVPDVDSTPLGKAFGIGVCQAVAIIPGVSRSGATIIGGMLLGLDRAVATEFSFFLAMPTLAAAFANSLWRVRHDITTGQSTLIAIGFVMAFISSALVIKPFLSYVRRSGFQPFAWYRIVVGILLLGALWSGWAR